MSESAKDGIKKLCSDFELWAEKAAKIRTKAGETKPLVLNKVQKRLKALVDEQLRTTGMVRIVILKARQQGLSTFVSAYLFHQLMHKGAKKGYVVAHKADSTAALWNMYQRLYRSLPLILQPITAKSSQKEMSFSELDTAFSVATAGGNSIARGETITHLHASEMAFWPGSAEEIWNGLKECVPSGADGKGSVVFVESTANGVGGSYYDLWQNAVPGPGGNGFAQFFSPWFETDEYRETPSPHFERTLEEEDLAQQFGLDDAQLQWRRIKIATSGRDLFEQEYPSTPEEAFKTSGSPVFPPEHIDAQAANAAPLIKRMQVYHNSVEDHSAGQLRVYKDKEKGEVYTIGADVAGGGSSGDFSVAQVLDGFGEQVAIWRGRPDPEYFADILNTLGAFYNLATMVIESNMHGRSTLLRLNSDFHYPKLYTQVRQGKMTDEETRQLGFLTTHASKPPLIDALRAAIREGEIKINDPETLKELKTYIFYPNESTKAQRGSHDDCVMSLAIAVHGLDRSFTPVQITDDMFDPVYW